MINREYFFTKTRNPKLKVDVSAKNIEKYYHIFLRAIQAYPND